MLKIAEIGMVAIKQFSFKTVNVFHYLSKNNTFSVRLALA